MLCKLCLENDVLISVLL
jgi:hypothetical protein